MTFTSKFELGQDVKYAEKDGKITHTGTIIEITFIKGNSEPHYRIKITGFGTVYRIPENAIVPT